MKRWLRKYRAVFGVIGLVLIILSTFAYAMFQGGFVSWFLFYSVIPLVAYSLFISFYRLQLLRVEREFNRDSMVAGDELIVRVKITSFIPIPLFFLVVRDRLPKELTNFTREDSVSYQSGSQALLFPLFKRHLSFTYRIPNIPRGVYEFTGVNLQSGDLFGFLVKETDKYDPKTVFVYPKFQDVQGFSLFNTQPRGMNKAGYRGTNDFSQAVSVRDYVPGDRLSWIHWKATARSTKLITKLFEIQKSDDFVILLDRNKQFYRSHGDDAFEKAISLVATLVKNSLDKGTPISFHSVGKQYIEFTSGNRKDLEADIFYHLAKAEADGERPLSSLLDKHSYKIPFGSTIIIIGSDLTNNFIKYLNDIVSDNISIVYFYIPITQADLDEQIHGSAMSRLTNAKIYVKPVVEDDFIEVLKAGV